MNEKNERDGSCRDKGDTNKAVGNTAMMLQCGYWALERPEHVDVSRLGREHHGHGRQGALAIEAGTPQAASCQEMRDRIQISIFFLEWKRNQNRQDNENEKGSEKWVSTP